MMNQLHKLKLIIMHKKYKKEKKTKHLFISIQVFM